ncbi:nad(p)h nitroreductase ydgi-related [Anaeramoeba flamelloides]|uniref:Nad(P)h nitroreductase ydgi-related n=1 Tax=Anaeramoeba flamelloides TaxID=1746091 RepID=A0AAV8A7N2_9EUKA|nr:nad(p)h nitroreductase ydgi-related [Anaeramoeba flamelloides]
MLNLLKAIPKTNFVSTSLQRNFSNAVLDCIKSRRSCRSFDPNKEVKRSDIEEILDIAKHSPSANHSQPWKVKITTNAPMLRRMGKEYFEVFKKDKQFRGFVQMAKKLPVSEPIFYDAPMAMFIYADLKRGKGIFTNLDVGIFVGSILHGLESKGLGGVALGVLKFQQDILEKEIRTEENEELLIGIGVGYAKEDFQPNKKNLKTDDVQWLD